MNWKQRQNLIVLLTFVALVVAVANNAAWAQPSEWAVELVDGGGDVESADLAYDPAGNPAITYATDYQVKFAHRYEGFWVLEDIGAASGNNGISLAYDTSGNATVSYTNDGLYFARRSGSTWVSELIDGSDDIRNRPVSLAYDNSGNPAISYCAGTNENKTVLKFAHYNGSSWVIEIVVDAPWTRYISLAYDFDGYPVIAYMDRTGHNRPKSIYFVKLARRNGDSWDIETVDSMSDPYYGFWVDLAFDPDGLPSIVYCKSVVAVHFARYDGFSWESEWIGSGMYPSLAYNSSGTAFVSYYDLIDAEPSVLKVAQRNAVSGEWETEIADWVSNVTSTDIAIDPAGNPAVRYTQNRNLKFAWRDPSNVAPTVTITSPADGSTFLSGDVNPIVFNGTAIDTEDGDLAADLTWTSDIDDYIGSGGSFSTILSVGRHIITASVTDSGGKTGSASVNITVGEQPTIHVEEIELIPGKAGKNYYAVVTVWIMDDVGADVEGATVYGQWSGAVSGTVSGVTDADGKVTGRSPKKKNGGTFIFTVTNVVLSGAIYSPGDNVETENSITVPVP